MRNNKFIASAVLALAMALVSAANVESASGADFRAQNNSQSQSADKRADALKKCASLLGVGLYLSRKETPPESPVAAAPTNGDLSTADTKSGA